MTPPIRCEWANGSEILQEYHDREWGVPLHDDGKHFEFLVLDSFQAGLSWAIVLRKRESLRSAFNGFDPAKVAEMNETSVAAILADPGVIRNRAKIEATIGNAQAFLQISQEFGSFDRYIWGFVGGRPIVNSWNTLSDLPAETIESKALSLDLRKRGFKFVGPTICYAIMQSAGLVNDHLTDCHRYREIAAIG